MKEKKIAKVWNSMELWFCMESCVFWALVGISMVSKPRV